MAECLLLSKWPLLKEQGEIIIILSSKGSEDETLPQLLKVFTELSESRKKELNGRGDVLVPLIITATCFCKDTCPP